MKLLFKRTPILNQIVLHAVVRRFPRWLRGVLGVETMSSKEHVRCTVERHSMFVKVALQSEAPHRAGVTQSSRAWTSQLRLLFGEDV
jgi:hypothetical protein